MIFQVWCKKLIMAFSDRVSSTTTIDKVPVEDMEDEIKSLAKLTHVIMEVVESIASRNYESEDFSSQHQAGPKSPPKEVNTRRVKSSQNRYSI